MIPILFNQDATSFDTYGIGALTEAVECEVTEERNGEFELRMSYPINGALFSEIEENKIIVAKPNDNDNNQAFRIYKVTEPQDGLIQVNAEHISYQLKYIPVFPMTATSASEAVTGVKSHSAVSNPFNFATDISSSVVFTTGVPKSARAILGGEDGSILQTYGGEYKWDNYNVSLLRQRGQDRGVTLRYGKNIVEFQNDRDLSETVTGILPYFLSGENYVQGDIITVENDLPYERIETVDVTGEFEDTQSTPTKNQVTSAGSDVLNRKKYLAIPQVNFIISFVALWQTEEYKDIEALEKVGLCDTVTIYYEPLGIETKAKVVKTIYNVLQERYNEIEVGDSGYKITSSLAEQTTKLSNATSRIEKLDDRITIEVSERTSQGENLQSQITVNANNISLKVSKGQVSSEISLESGQVTLTGNRLVVNSTNFQLDASGNATFSGTISSASMIGGTIYGTVITSGSTSSYYTEISGGTITSNHIQLGTGSALLTPSQLLLSDGNSQISILSNSIIGTNLLVMANEIMTNQITFLGTSLSLQTQAVMTGENIFTTIHYLGY